MIEDGFSTAQMRLYHGSEIADHYGSAVKEALAVRNGFGVIDLSHRGRIVVSGKDRQTFLHNMLSNDIKKLKTGEGLYAAMLNAQGRVLADLNLFCFEDSFLIDTDTSLRNKIPETLDRYIIMEDVKLQNAVPETFLFALEGPKAAEFTAALFGDEAVKLPLYGHAKHDLGGFPVELLHLSFTGGNGFAILGRKQDSPLVWYKLFEKGRSFKFDPFGFAALNILRLEAGIPWYGVDMDERNLLPEACLEDRAVSYNKGCYIGQEVIARLQSIAAVNKKLTGFEIETAEKEIPNGKIFKDGKEAGYLTSSVYSPALSKTIGLGYLLTAYAQLGLAVEIDSGGKKYQARTVSLPFVKAS